MILLTLPPDVIEQYRVQLGQKFPGVEIDVAATADSKLDYYAKAMQQGSENPADPLQTVRVLTIMRADEY